MPISHMIMWRLRLDHHNLCIHYIDSLLLSSDIIADTGTALWRTNGLWKDKHKEQRQRSVTHTLYGLWQVSGWRPSFFPRRSLCQLTGASWSIGITIDAACTDSKEEGLFICWLISVRGLEHRHYLGASHTDTEEDINSIFFSIVEEKDFKRNTWLNDDNAEIFHQLFLKHKGDVTVANVSSRRAG